MVQKRALLLVRMDPPESKVREFNDWYNNTHVVARLAMPGFLSARRFIKINGILKAPLIADDTEYLALYDLTSVKILRDKPYQELRDKEAALPPDSYETLIRQMPKFARATYEQIYPDNEKYIIPRTRVIFVVGHEVPQNRHQEFNAWYDTEHIPALLSVPGFLSVRRFKLVERPIVNRGGSVPQYFTIWDIEDENALASSAFQKAANSRWSDWVRSWYTRKIRSLYRCVFP